MDTARAGAQTATRVAAPLEDELVSALWAREIRVFPKNGVSSSLSDGELIHGLMTSTEARFRLAVIPLLLGHPPCDAGVDQVLSSLSQPRRVTLTLYYQAATYLQVLERDRLIVEHPLHDYFSAELSLPAAADLKGQQDQLEEALKATACLQAQTTGLDLNWVGAYKMSARFALKKSNPVGLRP